MLDQIIITCTLTYHSNNIKRFTRFYLNNNNAKSQNKLTLAIHIKCIFKPQNASLKCANMAYVESLHDLTSLDFCREKGLYLSNLHDYRY